MLSYEEIYEIVKERLSEKRFYLSECVVEWCIEYAKIYGVDVEKARIAGIAHDVAKEIPKEKQVEIAETYGIKLDEIEKRQIPLIHAKLGAEIARKEFGCTDDICEAIKWHTTGNENMSKLAKIVYASDKIDPLRGYDSKYMIDACVKNIDEGFVLVLKENYEFLLKIGLDLDKSDLTKKCLKYYKVV